MIAIIEDINLSVKKISRRDASIYRIKGCPHCGGEPIFSKTDRNYVITCPQYPEVNIHWPSSDHTSRELIFLIRDSNCDESFLLLGEDPYKVATRGAFDLRIRVK